MHQPRNQAKQAPSPRNVSTGSSRIDSADVAIPATALAADSAAASLGSAQSYQKVTQVYHTPEQVRTLVHLRLVLPDGSTQSLTATDGHPLKTLDGWRDAVLLKKGGQLLLGGGEVDSEPPRYASIADVRIEHARITTFNLEVANLHTFYVGTDGVVVHNGRAPKIRKDWEKYYGRDWPLNPMDSPIRPGGPQDAHHVLYRCKGGSDHPTNIVPKTPRDHIEHHKKYGYK